MSYINNYGQTIGPIKIENTWIGSSYNSDKIYLTFAKDAETIKGGAPAFFAPLLAETPSVNAPSNAVATIEWVRKYVEAGEGGFDLSEYAKKSELVTLNNKLTSLELKVTKIEEENHSYTTDINSLKNTTTQLKESVETNKQNISANTEKINNNTNLINIVNKQMANMENKIDSNTAAISNNRNNIAVNASKIDKNTNDIADIRSIVDSSNNNSSEAINKVLELEGDVLQLQEKVLANTDNIAINTNNITQINKTLEEHTEWINNPFPNGMIIVCGGATLNAS